MKVTVSRDGAPGARQYELADDAGCAALFALLKKGGDIPKRGGNCVWVLTAPGHEYMFAWYAKTGRRGQYLQCGLKEACGDGARLHLRRYESPLEWKEKLRQLYGGNDYMLWHDGWTDELEYCDFLAAPTPQKGAKRLLKRLFE